MRWYQTLLMAGLLFAGPWTTSSPAQAGPNAGEAAKPALEFSLKDLDGKVRTLKEQRGRVVAINFWATWCGPCRVELPKLNAIQDKLKGAPFTLYAVNVDNDQTVNMVKPLVKQQGYRFPVLLDTDNKIVSAYNQEGIVPYTVIVDHKGVIRHVHAGYNPGDEKIVEQEIRELLKAVPPAKSATKK